jgi:hypothetical protein
MDTPADNLTPKRIVLFLTAVDTVDGDLDMVVSAVVDDAESRGMFFEWAAIGDMALEDVVQGSPLHRALTGRFPDR